jgi:hypothetical protein
MKSEDIYNAWKRHRSEAEVRPDFTENVMKQVNQYEQRRKFSLFDVQWVVETITAHPLVQAAMIAIGALVGFIRLAMMLHIMLYT